MFIITQPVNQLANQLFTVASVIAAAIEDGRTVVNLGFGNYAGLYPSMRRDMLCRYPPRHSLLRWDSTPARAFIGRAANRLLSLSERGAPHGIAFVRSGHHSRLEDARGEVNLESPEMLELRRTASWIVLRGPLFRAKASLATHSDAIRTYFTPSEATLRHVESLIERLRGLGEVLVGVHVRRGDYARFLNGKFFYSPQEYLEVMRHVRTLFPGRKVVFLICSNEAQPPEVFRDLGCVMGNGSIIEDLHALSRCDFLVGPPSTYSAWASFYGRTPLSVMESAEDRPTLESFQVNVVAG